MGQGHDIDVLERLDALQRDALLRLVAEARTVDGASALNEQALLALGSSGTQPDVHHLLVRAADPREIVGYLYLDQSAGRAGSTAESVVHPAHRRAGLGATLVRRALDLAAPNPVLLWSHGDHPAASALAERLGFSRVRDLWQMRRDLADPLPAVVLPDGVRLRSFEVGRDEDEWLAVNRRAFADHPEQGAVSGDDLRRRIDASWFDPTGFFVAERAGRLIGFHWTKVHRGMSAGQPVGEVYVVGVDPAAQGGGLGRALTLAGLHYLRDLGLTEVLLYVEADNTPALAVYERLGFRHVATDTRYRHPGVHLAVGG